MNEIRIRKETESDYKKTEYMTLRAFWNIHGPGCNEHFLVHLLRGADCYVPELSRVANFDYVFIVTSLNENYNFNRIARYVSITLQGNGLPVWGNQHL